MMAAIAAYFMSLRSIFISPDSIGFWADATGRIADKIAFPTLGPHFNNGVQKAPPRWRLLNITWVTRGRLQILFLSHQGGLTGADPSS